MVLLLEYNIFLLFPPLATTLHYISIKQQIVLYYVLGYVLRLQANLIWWEKG